MRRGDSCLLPAEDLVYCLGLRLTATNEQPGCHLNLNDSTDAALLIAHLLTWSKY